MSPVSTSLRLVDRGAWLSVNGTRELGISDLWRFTGTEFCDCEVTDFLAEGFSELGVHSDSVEARLAGRCIQCGATGTTEWVTLGNIVDGDERTFRPVDPDTVQVLSMTALEDGT